jgi:hypothetical protein
MRQAVLLSVKIVAARTISSSAVVDSLRWCLGGRLRALCSPGFSASRSRSPSIYMAKPGAQLAMSESNKLFILPSCAATAFAACQ